MAQGQLLVFIARRQLSVSVARAQLSVSVARVQLSVSVARAQLFVLDLFSILVGFRCERVNVWWCRSIVFEIISWLP